MKFLGYKRPDGSVGIRNKVLIVAIDECIDGVARKINESLNDAVVLTNHYTCMYGGNEELVENIIGVALNPNIAGVLVLTMGCGSIDSKLITEPVIKSGKKAYALNCQLEKGSKQTVKRGIEIVQELSKYAQSLKREEVELSNLIVGVKCGGSDTSSGLASNPSVGKAADKIVDFGATAIVGELIELVGCEDILSKRAVNEEVANKLSFLIEMEEKRWDIPGANAEIMSIGNSIGGLTTIEEKSLGALYKTGTKPIQGVLAFSHEGIEKPTSKGLYLSEVSHLCGASGVNFAAMGAQVILWTTGSAGFENPIVPTIRVSGNEDLINDDVDIDATTIISGKESVNDVAERIVEKVISVANGEDTNVEGIGYSYCTLYQKDRRLEHYIERPCECSV
ncbi:MAG: UxaA family hydrolase [Clostridia bacterium]|nr:UxaA family hydrolase [Clostridia bacterium]